MSSDISAQVDVGALSLSGLGAFRTVLSTLSADDVQPMAMLQLQDLGSLFPISGPVASKVPDYLLRHKSVRIERLGLMVGWRKGDSASLMAQSTGGQAIALLSVCLCSLYKDTTGEILHAVSSAILPRSACSSSPGLLQKAAKILADKLMVIGFGNILAEQICRIHKAYDHLKQEVPHGILQLLDQDWMAEFFIGVSRALQEQSSILRVQGCCGLGYISALMITLFPDDCTITIEDLVVHMGKNTSSINVDIVGSSSGTLPEVHFLETVESIANIFINSGKAEEYAGREGFIRNAYLPNVFFSWDGHIAASLHIELCQRGFVCSTEVVKAVGICALAMAEKNCLQFSGPHSRIPAVSILGDNYRATIHRRCEIVMGVQLPLHWPSYDEAMRLLREAKKSMKSVGPDPGPQTPTRNGFIPPPSDTSLEILICAASITYRTLYLNAHDQALSEGISSTSWQYRLLSFEISQKKDEDWTWYADKILHKIFYSRMESSAVDEQTVAASFGTSTWVPSPFLALRTDDICHYRSVEVFDGPIACSGRYYDTVVNPGTEKFNNSANLSELGQKDNIVPSSEGCCSQLLCTTRERSNKLVLETTLIESGQKIRVSLAHKQSKLFGTVKTTPCGHQRTTPLKDEYCKEVLTTSALSRDPEKGSIAIVQTAGDPVSQILALTHDDPWPYDARAILCYRCCLNCAFEQAKDWKACKIVVA